MKDSREDWSIPQLEARLWYCEDDVCRCYQPQIDRIVPNLGAGYPWIKREIVWRGYFISDPSSDELDELLAQLKAECLKLGIPLENSGYGRRSDMSTAL